MSNPKPSRPLWALEVHGNLSAATAVNSRLAYHECYWTILHPCRLVPGHGKVVPVELVEAIRDRYEALLRHYGDQWLDVEPVAEVSDAIDAALGGAM